MAGGTIVNKAIKVAGVVVASIGFGVLAPAAAWAGYPPESTTTTDPIVSVEPPVSVSADPPVPTTPGASVSAVSIVAGGSLPATGTDTTLLLQIGTATFVVGLTSVVLVRRRRPTLP